MDWTRKAKRPAFSGASKYTYSASSRGLNVRVEQTLDGWEMSNWEDVTGDDFVCPEIHKTKSAALAAAETLCADY